MLVCLASTVVFIFFLLPTLTQQTFNLFSCTKLGIADNDYFLNQDMHIRCYTPVHYAWLLGLGIPMLIAYVAGIPVISFYILYQRRDELNTPAVKRRFFFF